MPLLEAGANSNAKNRKGRTPLYSAAAAKLAKPRILEIRLAASAASTLTDMDGKCLADVAMHNLTLRNAPARQKLCEASAH